MPVLMPEPKNTLLGKETTYSDQYNPNLLQAIARSLGRDVIGAHDFRGTDIWRLYELSWLDSHGKPQTAVAELWVPASTPSIVESKSLKLYAGSFAMTKMKSMTEVAHRMTNDLSKLLAGEVKVILKPYRDYSETLNKMPGTSLDDIAFEGTIENYETDSRYLAFAKEERFVKETFSTSLFRSLCPVTGQPDMASIMIHYEGRAIDPAGLLRYLVSYRCHKGFHEQCVEQIYHDLRTAFNPKALEVYACFTRRGGIDINPFRSSFRDAPSESIRELRQ